MKPMSATRPVSLLHEMSALEITTAIGGGRTTCEAVARTCLEPIAAREFAERNFDRKLFAAARWIYRHLV